MKTNILFSGKTLFMKIALLAALIVGGGNFAWGDELTVSNGSNTNSFIPIYYNSLNANAAKSQFVIPSDSLGIIENCSINGLKFYLNSTSTVDLASAQFSFYLKEVNYSAFTDTAFVDWESLTSYYTGTIKINSGVLTVSLSSSFPYGGGNLLIGVKQILARGSNPSSFIWKGTTTTYYSGKAASYASGKPSNRQFLPKITFDYTAAGCAKPTSLNSSSVTHNSATVSWNSSADAWQVAYTKDSEVNPNDLTPINVIEKSYDMSELDDYTTYYVYVRTDCGGGSTSEWAATSFTTLEEYPRPTDFALDSKDGTSATFSWTAGDETAWQIAYSEDTDFNPDNKGTKQAVLSNPYTLSGLTTGTTYYAYIRADYGDSHFSRWSDEKIEFTPSNEITINELASTSTYQGPFHGAYVGQNNFVNQGQIIIPSNALTDINNRQITSIKFYTTQSDVSWGNAKFDVYVKETTKSNYSQGDSRITPLGVKVLSSASLSVLSNEMVVDLETPFNYTTENLLISFNQVEKGSASTASWVSMSGTYHIYYSYYNGNSTFTSRNSYSLKSTITAIPVTNAYVKIGATGYTTFASSWPLDLSNLPSGLTAYYVASGAVDGDIVHLTPITTAVEDGTGLILKGTANTTYAIPVANSGSDISARNLLVGVTPLETVLAVNKTSGYNNYVLVNNGGTPEFQSLADNGATIPGGKAYLSNGEYVSGSRSLRIVFDDEESTTTGIVNHNRETVTTQRYYNLQGQRMTKPLKGIYIVDGKKVIMK